MLKLPDPKVHACKNLSEFTLKAVRIDLRRWQSASFQLTSAFWGSMFILAIPWNDYAGCGLFALDGGSAR